MNTKQLAEQLLESVKEDAEQKPYKLPDAKKLRAYVQVLTSAPIQVQEAFITNCVVANLCGAEIPVLDAMSLLFRKLQEAIVSVHKTMEEAEWTDEFQARIEQCLYVESEAFMREIFGETIQLGNKQVPTAHRYRRTMIAAVFDARDLMSLLALLNTRGNDIYEHIPYGEVMLFHKVESTLKTLAEEFMLTRTVNVQFKGNPRPEILKLIEAVVDIIRAAVPEETAQKQQQKRKQ